MSDGNGNGALRINVGAGSVRLDGWTGVDRLSGQEAYPLPFPDSSAEQIRASHILEHFSFAEVPKVLADWRRVLKPGGTLEVAVPDFDKIKVSDDPKAPLYLMGGQTDVNDFHKSVFTEDRLRASLQEAGFGDVAHWKGDQRDTSSHPISLNLQGTKPLAEVRDLRICAAMSLPRVGFNDSWGMIHEALVPLKIPIRRYTGAYWGQCLQNVLQDCLDQGIDWVLCLDYDSMFTAEDVSRLLQELGGNPEIDALAALQCRRDGDTPLMTCGRDQVAYCDGQPIKVTTAHFGMTLIRMDRLTDLPKPWFVGQPGPDGSWRHDERLDPDIWFWHQWRLAGKTVYVTPNVRIGHLEAMVRDFDDELKPRVLTVGEWRDSKNLYRGDSGGSNSESHDESAAPTPVAAMACG
jgi:predicted SAM-dependent methyltransferase